jgi:glucan phosphoethanolaminetransferase (alkaline phosphatase superfamily)
MFARIQSVYLILVFLAIGILPFVFPLWHDKTEKFYFMKELLYQILFGAAATITVMSLISFKKRLNQFVYNRLIIILNLILLGLFAYRSLNLSGEVAAISKKGIGMFLPIVAIVLLVLANKAIKKDEDLVKSADRLR